MAVSTITSDPKNKINGTKVLHSKLAESRTAEGKEAIYFPFFLCLLKQNFWGEGEKERGRDRKKVVFFILLFLVLQAGKRERALGQTPPNLLRANCYFYFTEFLCFHFILGQELVSLIICGMVF